MTTLWMLCRVYALYWSAYGCLVLTAIAWFLAIRFFLVSRCSALLGAIICIAFEIMFFLMYNPLPDDERIIAVFARDRQAFNAIASGYRENVGLAGHGLDDAILRNLGIDHVRDENGFWIADPKSPPAGQFDLGAAQRHTHSGFKWAVTVCIEFLEANRFRQIWPWRGVIWKNLVNFPEPPNLSGTELVAPADPDGYKRRLGRLLRSLNWNPIWWGAYECVYRRVDSTWYLQMCRAG